MTPVVLTWLGQSSLLVEAGGARLLIDPFFSEHEGRTFPPPPVDVFGARRYIGPLDNQERVRFDRFCTFGGKI